MSRLGTCCMNIDDVFPTNHVKYTDSELVPRHVGKVCLLHQRDQRSLENEEWLNTYSDK